MGLVLNRPSDAPVGDAVPDLAWVAPTTTASSTSAARSPPTA